MKNFFPLIIILIIASSLCTSTEEKTKKDESTNIFNSLINCASNFYSNYLESTVKYVSCPLGSKGCEIAANIQIASEGLKTAGIGQEAGAKIIEKVIDKTSTEGIKEVAEKKAEKVVYEWGTKTSLSFFKIIPAISSGFSFYIMLIKNLKMVIILVVHFMVQKELLDGFLDYLMFLLYLLLLILLKKFLK